MDDLKGSLLKNFVFGQVWSSLVKFGQLVMKLQFDQK